MHRQGGGKTKKSHTERTPPPKGRLKLYVDRATRDKLGVAGIKGTSQNDTGEVL